jgi:hypothetical protein
MRATETFSAGFGKKKARQLDLFVAALLSNPTVEAAAAAARISRATAYRWLSDPDVQRRIAEARRDALNRAIARLQEAATEAVDCLREVQRDGESESARVSAARCIIEQALRAAELGDIEERLRVLEQLAKNRWKGPDHDQRDYAQDRTTGGANGHA